MGWSRERNSGRLRPARGEAKSARKKAWEEEVCPGGKEKKNWNVKWEKG
jgi:hypothetical protein